MFFSAPPPKAKRRHSGAAVSTEQALARTISRRASERSVRSSTSSDAEEVKGDELFDDDVVVDTSDDVKARERHYVQQLEILEETGATLREAWSQILQSSQRQLDELRRELRVRRHDRDEARRRLKETRDRITAEETEVVAGLKEAKLAAAQIALETDELKLRLASERRRRRPTCRPRDEKT
mmetsp:Transcript_288/g.745  ORF Transcript_288/g.745 Transcript_288/m.745 type:complete len:182 (+) Transcript_288:47-592(+)